MAIFEARSSAPRPFLVRCRPRTRRSSGSGRRSTSPASSRWSTSATIRLAGTASRSASACWDCPSAAATKRIRRNSRGPMPTGSSASVKALEEKKPSCEIRKPTLRGAVSGSGGSIRSSSSCHNRKFTLGTDSWYKLFRYETICPPGGGTVVLADSLGPRPQAHRRTHLDSPHDRRHRGRRPRHRRARPRVLGPQQGGLGDQRRDREALPRHRRRHRAAGPGRDAAEGHDGRLAAGAGGPRTRSTARSREALPRLARRLLRLDAATRPSSRRTAARPSRSSTRSPTRIRRSARTRRPRRRRARR